MGMYIGEGVHLLRSLRRMREKIMPTIPERNTRITIELMIENLPEMRPNKFLFCEPCPFFAIPTFYF